MRYRAFISYASADRVLGERFQKAVEYYRIPKPLRGADRGSGIIPKRLTPLFRDRSDANAAGDLGAALDAALASSDALVPLCSPAAAQSQWVNHEIRKFKTLGRGGRIFPVILSGTPRRYDPERAPDGAFPPALFQRVDATGAIVEGEDPDPLAADIRPEGDGFDSAKLKVVAALTNIPLGELTSRQREAEGRERRVARIVGSIISVLVIIAVVAPIIAYRSTDRALLRLSYAIELVASRLADVGLIRDRYGVSIEVVRDELKRAERELATLTGNTETNVPMIELQHGRSLLQLSSQYGAVGDREKQLARARVGVAILDRVPIRRQLWRPSTWLTTLPAAPDLTGEQLAGVEALARALLDNQTNARDVAMLLERGRTQGAQAGRQDFVARFWSLDSERAYIAGDLAMAHQAQTAALTALAAYLAAFPSADTSAERAAALSDRAEILLESERYKEALADQAAAVAVFETQAAAAPDDNSAQRRLAQAITQHGDLLQAVPGCWTESLPKFERARSLLTMIYNRDPSRLDYARDLTIVLERIGDVMLESGNLAAARNYFNELVALRSAARARADNQDSRRDLAFALERQGDLALIEKTPARALSRFEEARSLRGRDDPSLPIDQRDPVLARDLAVLWSKTGAARSAARQSSWREAYETSIRLVDPFIASAQTPPGWLRDVAVFRSGYGDALARAGQTAEARKQWSAARSLIEQQLKIQPGDPRLAADRGDLDTRLRTGRVPAAAQAQAPAQAPECASGFRNPRD
jgi:tetratricopeptide (TPR) repeat protein